MPCRSSDTVLGIPFFFAFWGLAKVRKKQKSQSWNHFSALHLEINLVGIEGSLGVDLFLYSVPKIQD